MKNTYQYSVDSIDVPAKAVAQWCRNQFGKQTTGFNRWRFFLSMTGSNLDNRWFFANKQDYTLFLLKWK